MQCESPLSPLVFLCHDDEGQFPILEICFANIYFYLSVLLFSVWNEDFHNDVAVKEPIGVFIICKQG